jgi:hypothetical protein
MRLRYTPESFKNMRKNADAVLSKIREMEAFLSGFDREWWKNYTKLLMARVESLREFRNENHTKMSNEELRASIAQEKAHIFDMQIPEEVLSQLTQLRQGYSEQIEKINAYRDKAS